jgi:hypothetical protein
VLPGSLLQELAELGALLRVHAGDGVLGGLLVNVGGGLGGDLLKRPIASLSEMPS